MNQRSRILGALITTCLTFGAAAFVSVWFARRNGWSLEMPLFTLIATGVPLTLYYETDLSPRARMLLNLTLMILLALAAFGVAVGVDPKTEFSWRGLGGAVFLGAVIGVFTSIGFAGLRRHY